MEHSCGDEHGCGDGHELHVLGRHLLQPAHRELEHGEGGEHELYVRGAKDFSQNISSWNVRYLDSGYRFCLDFCLGAGEITPPEFEKSPSTKKPLCGDPQCPEKKA